MTTTVMPEQAGVSRIPAVSRFLPEEETRLDLSAVIGLDVDLVLGADDDPARAAALADMIDTGFVDVADAVARLSVVAAELAIDTPERETAEALGGWAA